MCDCKDIEEIPEQTGNIAMIQRWAQELFGYHFTVVQRKEKIMTYVSALTRRFSPSYALHLSIYFILRQVDRLNRSQAYSYEYFKENIPVRTKPTAEAELLPTLVLTLSGINAYTNNTLTNITPLSNPSPLLLFRIQYSPVLILASPTIQYHTSLPYQKRISNK